MAGERWLDAAKFPNITFAIKSLALKGDNKVLTNGNSVQADATGEFTLHGVTKTITIPVRATYRELPKGQVDYLEGNILRIETTFGIKLSDYGVNIPAPLTAKVANELTLTVKATAKQK
jgi:polyisoprenoid-binding protein YceI